MALLILDRAEASVIDKARSALDEMTAPLLGWLNGPVTAVQGWTDRAQRYFSLYEENQRLRAELEDLREWRDVALKLERKTARYEALLNVKLEPGIRYVTARVTNDTGGPFVKTFLTNSGTNDGLRPGNGAIDSRGLVGRVVSVQDAASRILLVTDLNSRVPVRMEPSGERGLLVGTNLDEPVLSFLRPDAVVTVGDRIVTSGDGGQIPAGIPVGLIGEEVRNGYRVSLFADINNVSVVRLIDFDRRPIAPVVADGPATGPQGIADQPVRGQNLDTPPAAGVQPEGGQPARVQPASGSEAESVEEDDRPADASEAPIIDPAAPNGVGGAE
ncbi:MAG: rod shape-determining protein MreC [Pseudomonadota bacterium]